LNFSDFITICSWFYKLQIYTTKTQIFLYKLNYNNIIPGRSSHSGGQNSVNGGLAGGGEVMGEHEGITCDQYQFDAGVGAGLYNC